MAAVYEVTLAPEAPRLSLVPGWAEGLLRFDGRERWREWPEPPPQVTGDVDVKNPFVFYGLAEGALVVRSEAFVASEDFHWVTRHACERLAVVAGEVTLEIIHPVEVVPTVVPTELCGFYGGLFRVDGQPPERLFCGEGVASVPLNEFLGVYRACGFVGLHFTEVWRGEVRAT